MGKNVLLERLFGFQKIEPNDQLEKMAESTMQRYGLQEKENKTASGSIQPLDDESLLLSAAGDPEAMLQKEKQDEQRRTEFNKGWLK